MRKLYQLKKWYTIEETANRLTLTLGEPVSSADVLRLMAEGQLGAFWYVQDRDAVELGVGDWYLTGEMCVGRLSEKTSLLRGIYRLEMGISQGVKDWLMSLARGDGRDANVHFGGSTCLVDEQNRMWELLERLDEQYLQESAQDLAYDDVSNYKSSDYRPRRDEIIVVKQELEQFEAQFSQGPERSAAVVGVQDDQQSSDARPWGNHETKLLRALAEASDQWWRTYDRDDKTTAPTNEDVAAWLRQKHGVAQRVAEVMAQILRADDIPQGPRRK